MTKTMNPYRQDSTYARLFEYLRTHDTVTRKQLQKYAIEKMGLRKASAEACVSVLLSPRQTSNGNLSSRGSIYFVEKLPRKGQSVFRLKWRVKDNVDPEWKKIIDKAQANVDKANATLRQVKKLYRQAKDAKETAERILSEL